MRQRLRDENGFTLVEALVVLVVTSLLVTFVLRFHVLQNKEYDLQGQISFLQKNVRSAMEAMEEEIRMAGSGFPAGALASSVDIIDSGTDSDEIVVMRAVPGVRAVLTETMPNPSAELKCDDVSGFEEGWAVIADEVGSETFLITHVQDQADHLQHNTMTFSRPFEAGSWVIQASYRQYCIDRESDPEHPKLVLRDYDGSDQIVAENIDDIQFAYVLEDFSETPTPPADMDEVIMVRISIVGRTARADPSFPGDGYRRRELITRVKLRNFHLKKGI
ncbi:MAG: prepilin-type N-terminal cleavage/methylation domain-containing protein [bacterium]